MSPAPREIFVRHPANPILCADHWPYPVNAVFNPGAALVDGETVLIARVEDRRGISHLSVARSRHGIGEWKIAREPLLAPADGIASEQWGFEDARVVWVEELGRWVITCTAYGPLGPHVFMATTTDFRTVERHGIIGESEDKNAALLPARIGGKWVLFHRPMMAAGGGEILLSRSEDLRTWTPPEQVLAPRPGAWWDSLRVGIGPPPIRTDRGWLLIYHGVKETVAGTLYRVGVALLDLDEPTRVIGRAPEWVLSPTERYERTGDVPNTVFPCGAVYDESTRRVRLYYGAADTSICLATASLEDLVAAAERGSVG